MIDWLDRVLRRIGKTLAMSRRRLLVKCNQFWNFEVSPAAIQWNGVLRAKRVVILDTGHYLTSHPKDINMKSFIDKLVFCLYVPMENFSLIWRRHHYWWRASTFFTYTRHSWQMNSEGSLACHTYCDTGHPFKMVISEDPWHTPVAERLAVELSLLV